MLSSQVTVAPHTLHEGHIYDTMLQFHKVGELKSNSFKKKGQNE